MLSEAQLGKLWKSNRNYSINSHHARNKKILAARKMLPRHPNAKTGCRKPTKQIPLSWLTAKKKERKHGREDKKRGCRASNQPPWYLQMPPNPSCFQDGRRKSPWITTIRPPGDNRSGWMKIKVMAQGWPLFLSSQGWVTLSWEAALFVVLQSCRIIITTNALAIISRGAQGPLDLPDGGALLEAVSHNSRKQKWKGAALGPGYLWGNWL